ncbi:hypothetical protein [Nonlabens sp. Asnod2-A12]
MKLLKGYFISTLSRKRNLYTSRTLKKYMFLIYYTGLFREITHFLKSL